MMPSFLYESQPMSPRTKEACEGAKAAQNRLDMEWDGITLGNQISWLDWTSTILAASTLVSAHILLHVPMSSEKWGSSQMLGTTSTKTIVDYRDGTQLFAPVDNNWCQGNHLICQFCQRFVLPCLTILCLGHDKLFGFGILGLRLTPSRWHIERTSAGIESTRWVHISHWNGQSLPPNRTTPMLKTSPRGYQTPVLQGDDFQASMNSRWAIWGWAKPRNPSTKFRDSQRMNATSVLLFTFHRTSRSLEECSQECHIHLLCCW